MELLEQPQQLPVPDADLRLWTHLELDPGPDACLRRLIGDTPWRQDEVQVWGKIHRQPRLHAWYGDRGSGYRYSGLTLTPLPWTPLLNALKLQVEDLCGECFNSVLLNYYRNHRDGMGMHADDEPELGGEPAIASLSLGEERVLRFKHRRDNSMDPVKVPLPHGSLLLMKGATQANWHHGINKQSRPCGARVNLTFRRVITQR
jgi:alkylated DNA repair dioxygenase AlkB